MKKSVVDIHDLQDMDPFFKGTVGTFIGKLLIKYLCVEKVNKVHGKYCHLRGADFTSAILQDSLINIQYKIHNEKVLDNLPGGAFIAVANHPVGSIDGIVLIDLFAKLRPDFKVMVNGVLARIGAMEDNFISVKPDSERQGANLKNVNGIRSSFEHLQENHPMGFFPAGAISSYDKDKKQVRDLPWTHSVIRLIRKANVPVYPVYFDFYNSRFFYWLGTIDWRIRMFRIPAEVFNKRGKTLDVYIGNPISPEEIQNQLDDDRLATFLYNKTYGAKR